MTKSALTLGKALLGRLTAGGPQITSRRQFHNFPWAAPRSAQAGQELLISVILPVYNHARFAAAALDSILGQRRCALEVLLVDDGSTDGLEAVLKDYQNDRRLIVHRQPNRGLPAALNRGLQAASGDFITWTSADNLYRGEALAEMADFLISNPSVGLVYANVELIDNSGALVTQGCAYRPQDQDPVNRALLRLPLAADSLAEWHDNFVNACFLFRKEVAQQTGLYKGRLKNIEDFDYWLRASLSLRAAHIDTDEPFYRYRVHADSLTGKADSNRLEAEAKELARSFRAARRAARSAELTVSMGSEAAEPLMRLHEILGSEHPVRSNENYATLGAEPLSLIVEGYSPINLQEPFGRVELASLNPPAFPSSPLLCGILSAGSPLVARSLINEASSAILPPEVTELSFVRRARDCDFGAIKPARGSKGSLLALVQTGPNARAWAPAVTKLVKTYSDYTFTLFAHTKEERSAADAVNLSLPANANLRIIDCSGEFRPDGTFDFAPLMYALSSADALLSVHGEEDAFSALHEILSELALAALAGRRLVSLTAFEAVRRPSLGFAVNTEELQPFYISALAAELRTAPHLTTLGLSRAAEDFGRAAQSACRPPDVRSQEQWLERYTRAGLRRRLIAVLNAQ